MMFSRLLRVGIIGFGVVLVTLLLLQYVWGEPFYANLATYGAVLAACVVLYRLARPTSSSRAETILRLGAVYTLLLVFLQRIVFLIPFSDSFGRADAMGNPLHLYTLKEFHWGILTYLSFVVVFFIGVRMALRRTNRSVCAARRSRDQLPFAARRLFFCGAVVVFLLVQIFTFVFGWRMGGEFWEFGFLIRLLPASLFTWVVVLLYFAHHDTLTKFERVFIIGLLAVQAIMTLVQGSRSGLLSFAEHFLFGALFVHGNFRVPRRFLVGGGVAVLLVGPLFWSIGTHIRGAGSFGFDPMPVTDIVRAISSRFGNGTENFIISMNGWLNADEVHRYLTLRNVIGSGVNAIVPGEVMRVPFEEMGDLWETLAWGIPLESRRHAEWWHVGAQLTIMFGYGVALFSVTAFGAFSAWMLSRFLAHETFSGLLAAALMYTIVRSFFNGQNLDGMMRDIIMLPLYLLALFLITRSLLIIAPPSDHRMRRVQYVSTIVPSVRSPSA